MSELRITGISVDLVRWPLKMKRRHGVGDIEGSMPGAIVKISTNAGIVGWGEASPWSVFTGTAEANASAIHLYVRPLVVGADPLKVSTLMRNPRDAAFISSRALDRLGPAKELAQIGAAIGREFTRETRTIPIVFATVLAKRRAETYDCVETC
jgi:hypothetical protein